MKKLVPLMQREWLQHRFGWALMAGLPLAAGLVFSGYGHVQVGDMNSDTAGAVMPALLTLAAIAATAGLVFFVVWLGALIIVSGLARRDHADRSIEFWLSLPTSHAESLLSPMLVHLILAPAAALLVGLVGGYAVSLVLVSRAVGIEGWLALPWLDIGLATVAIGARLLIGLPLATLWLAPLVLAVMLLSAWFRKWSWVVIGVGIGLGSFLLDRLFGQPFLSQAINGLMQHAMHAFAYSPQGGDFHPNDADSAYAALRSLPRWALLDTGRALRDLASPLLLGGLAVAAGCFALLVKWRERQAGAFD